MTKPVKPTAIPNDLVYPVRGEPRATFATKDNTYQQRLVDEVVPAQNNLANYGDAIADYADDRAVAAAASASTATTQAGIATTQAGIATNAADSAEADRITAETAAAAAQSAAGLPSLTGNALYSLTVNESEDGVRWQLVGREVGLVESRPGVIEDKWLNLNGMSYLQSEYPELFALYPQWAYDLVTTPSLPSLNGNVRDMAANDTHIAVGGDFTTTPARLHIIEIATMTRLTGTFSPVGNRYAVDFHPDGSQLAVAGVGSGGNGGLVVLDTADFTTQLFAGTGYADSRLCRYSPSGDHLITISGTTEARVLETSTFTTVHTKTGIGTIVGACFNADGSQFAIVTTTSPRLYVYDTATGDLITGTPTLPQNTNISNRSIDWVGDRFAVCFSVAPRFYTYDTSSGWSLEYDGGGYPQPVATISISPDEAYLVVGPSSETNRLFDLPTFFPNALPALSVGSNAGFTKTGRHMFECGSTSPYYKVYNAKSETEFTLPNPARLGKAVVWKVRYEI